MSLVEIALAIITVALFRFLWLIRGIGQRPQPHRRKRVSVLAIAGSGGHTTELLRLLSSMTEHYTPIHYVLANTDAMSKIKIGQLEDKRNHREGADYFINEIPRSREVAQPWLSSAFTTLRAILYAFPIVWNAGPDLILCTGPGTCIPLCLVGFLYKFLGVGKSRIIFVESICRVNTMSLSGRILYHWVDKMFVQWPGLQHKYPKSLYIGRIV